MIGVISQILIFVLGGAAMYLLSRTDSIRRWGFILGLCGQPFWFYTQIVAENWGVVALSCVYTFAWCNGIYNYWIKKEAV